jgi:hypothetical protein
VQQPRPALQGKSKAKPQKKHAAQPKGGGKFGSPKPFAKHRSGGRNKRR